MAEEIDEKAEQTAEEDRPEAGTESKQPEGQHSGEELPVADSNETPDTDAKDNVADDSSDEAVGIEEGDEASPMDVATQPDDDGSVVAKSEPAEVPIPGEFEEDQHASLKQHTQQVQVAPVGEVRTVVEAEEQALAEEPPKEKMDVSHPLAQDIILNPTKWLIWPAVAVLRWLLRRAAKDARRIIYRSEPSLNFPTSEINDIAVDADGIELILNAPGLAVAGSALPLADIERIIKDKRNGGALANFLDGIGDRLMHVVESSQARTNAAFSLAIGGHIEFLSLTANLTGRSAPLTAFSGGELSTDRQSVPEGATGLTSMYVGPISAARMEDLFYAVTSFPAKVREFTGAEILVLAPARLGSKMGAMLGLTCNQPEAGVEVVINGGSDPEAVEWAANPVRRKSLHLLADSFVGSPCPEVSLFLLLSVDNVPLAGLDGKATLGGLAVLGKPQIPVFIPLL